MSTGEQGGRDPQPIAPAKFGLKSALVIVAVGLLLAWAWTPSRPEEPVYQGKTLRVWLKAYAESESGSEVQAESEAAIRSIGTNGIPTLLRLIQTPDSTFRTKLQALVEKQPFIKFNFADAERIRVMGVRGFKALGESTKGAVPDLLTLVKGGSGTVGREEAIYCLAHIGPSAQAAIPALLVIASDAKDQNRSDAFMVLGYIHASPESVVPFLTSRLRDPDEVVRLNAIRALYRFGEAAKSAVPSLNALLTDPSEYMRERATNALKLIDREAATKAGIP